MTRLTGFVLADLFFVIGVAWCAERLAWLVVGGA